MSSRTQLNDKISLVQIPQFWGTPVFNTTCCVTTKIVARVRDFDMYDASVNISARTTVPDADRTTPYMPSVEELFNMRELQTLFLPKYALMEVVGRKSGNSEGRHARTPSEILPKLSRMLGDTEMS